MEMKKCPNCFGCGTVWFKRSPKNDKRHIASMRCPVCKGTCKVPA